jgi:hypothetical protein
VASLSELTDRSAVERALEEFLELGPDRFRARYGLERSRDYFVPFRGVLCDSKPILAVAYRNQHPERGLLSVRAFSGGTGGAVQALRRLGFEAVTRAQLDPPVLGEEHATRTEIYEAYGGDKVAGIIRLPGDDVVNVFSDAEGPYADDPPTLTEPFGYRGEGLNGPQQLTASGNARLEQARSGSRRCGSGTGPPAAASRSLPGSRCLGAPGCPAWAKTAGQGRSLSGASRRSQGQPPSSGQARLSRPWRTPPPPQLVMTRLLRRPRPLRPMPP